MLKNAGLVCVVLCVVPVLAHLVEGAQAGTGNNQRSLCTQPLCIQPRRETHLHYLLSNRPPDNHWTSSMQSKPTLAEGVQADTRNSQTSQRTQPQSIQTHSKMHHTYLTPKGPPDSTGPRSMQSTLQPTSIPTQASGAARSNRQLPGSYQQPPKQDRSPSTGSKRTHNTARGAPRGSEVNNAQGHDITATHRTSIPAPA
jgi:hypothetical protein